MVTRYPGRGTGVLDRTTTTATRVVITDPEEHEEGLEGTLGRAKSSLTVIENPSLDGKLGILMADTTIWTGDEKAFMNAYIIIADRSYAITEVRNARMARTEHRRSEPVLYTLRDNSGSIYPVGSLLPYELCKITNEEFKKYESTLRTAEHQLGFAGVVNDMARLLAERNKFYSLNEGKLILPPNYASTGL